MVKPTRLGYCQYLLGSPMNSQVTLNIEDLYRTPYSVA